MDNLSTNLKLWKQSQTEVAYYSGYNTYQKINIWKKYSINRLNSIIRCWFLIFLYRENKEKVVWQHWLAGRVPQVEPKWVMRLLFLSLQSNNVKSLSGAQSDHSLSSASESSSESLYSTAMRRERMVATSHPTSSLLFCSSCCSWTFFNWIPVEDKCGLCCPLSFKPQTPKKRPDLCGWQTTGRFSDLLQTSPQLCCRCALLQEGGQLWEVEVGDLGEVGQVAGGVWGLSANPHYVALVPVHPNENQRLSGLTGVEGWVGLGLEEVGGWNWWAEKERGLWLRGIIFKSASDYANNK